VKIDTIFVETVVLIPQQNVSVIVSWNHCLYVATEDRPLVFRNTNSANSVNVTLRSHGCEEDDNFLLVVTMCRFLGRYQVSEKHTVLAVKMGTARFTETSEPTHISTRL
jgi:hypothetical protein